jgi:hypothetical protein
VYEDSTWTTFEYDETGRLAVKELYNSGSLEQLFTYEYPDENTIIYRHCLTKNAEDNCFTCKIHEGNFDVQNNLIKYKLKSDIDSCTVLTYFYVYDDDGNLLSKKLEKRNNHKLIKTHEGQLFRDRSGRLIAFREFEDNELNYYRLYSYEYYEHLIKD